MLPEAFRWSAHAGALVCGISVNICGRQLQLAMVDTVIQVLARAALPPVALIMEMTEEVLIEHTESNRDILRVFECWGYVWLSTPSAPVLLAVRPLSASPRRAEDRPEFHRGAG